MGIEGEEFQVKDRKYLQQIIEEPFLNLTEENIHPGTRGSQKPKWTGA